MTRCSRTSCGPAVRPPSWPADWREDMRTPLCELLGIDVAIIQAPMAGGWTTPALVAEVSEAGGLGTLAGGRMAADTLRAQIDETRRRTRKPFGINFLIPEPAPDHTDD